MAGTDWLAAQRTEVAADRILDAAETLFTERGPDTVGMNEIARAAGCSRATLYRYFENRDALRTAYVNRETYRVNATIEKHLHGLHDPRERLVTALTTAVRAVRDSPALSSWFAANHAPVGAVLAEQSEVITAIGTAFLNSLVPDETGMAERRARWLLRVITSLLLFPGPDEDDEKAMIEQFVIPVVLPAGQAAQ